MGRIVIEKVGDNGSVCVCVRAWAGDLGFK